MSDYKATPEQWAQCEQWTGNPVLGASDACLLELRARVEQLEAKYETQRLATLEWGEDVDKVKRWSDQHLQRIEKLEKRFEVQLMQLSDLQGRLHRHAIAVGRLEANVYNDGQPEANTKPSQNRRPAPSGLLVRRVAGVLAFLAAGDRSPQQWEQPASTVITGIAAELRARNWVDAADWLEQGAER